MSSAGSLISPLTDAPSPAPVQLSDDDLGAFQGGLRENRKFWARFGYMPEVKDRAILDVGSGWGRLGVDLAQGGARRVVGLDLKQHLVDFANENVRQSYPRLASQVTFERCNLPDYDEAAAFDLIVSKDSLEHVLDLESMLAAIRKRLKLGGRAYLGFGPLYRSPYGDHDRRAVAFAPLGFAGTLLARTPWLHLPLEQTLLELHGQKKGRPLRSIHDLDLNGLAFSDFRRAFDASGLFILDMRVNRGGLASKVLSALALVPALKDYCVHNVYCILEKR